MSGYQAFGQQVKHGRDHVADACDTRTAARIAEALNMLDASEREPDERQMDLAQGWEPPTVPFAPDDGDTYGAYTPGLAERHNIRQESDEYACSCGLRWDVQEGHDHP